MNWLRRMMYGRYGVDQLNYALMGLYVVLYFLSILFHHSRLLSLLSTLCIVLTFYRMLSRQLDRRRAENARFLEAAAPLLRRYNACKSRRRDRDHAYFRCPNCGQQLRVPKGKGKISITCRSCGVSFEAKT